MSPRVPTYEQQVQVRSPRLQTPTLSQPIEAASGAQVDEAQQRLGQTLINAGTQLGNHLIERAKKEREKKQFQLQSAFNDELQNTLYSKDRDDNGRPVGFLNRELDHANGATPEFTQKVTALKQKYVDMADSDGLKEALEQRLTQMASSTRETVIRHEAAQWNKSFEQATETAAAKDVALAASLKRPEALAAEIARASTDYINALSKTGAAGETAAFKGQMLAGKMAESAFMAELESNPKNARALIDAAKPYMTEQQYADLENKVAGKEFDQLQASTWERLKGIKGPDGLPDAGKIKAAAQSMDLEAGKKKKLFEYLDDQVNTVRRDWKKAVDEGDYAFKNDILAMKEKGARLQDALKVVADSKYGPADNVMKADRAEIAKKIWNEKTITDPETYNNLWFAIANGQAGRAEVDAAYKTGLLSASDWQGLGKHWYGTEHKSDDILMKHTMDRVQLLADSNFPGSRKKEKDSYIYAVMQGVKGKTPAETLEYANKLLEKDPNTGFMGFFQKPSYKTQNQITDAQNEATAMIMKDLGPEVTSAILDGKYKGKPGDPIQAVDEFATAFGGKHKIAPGTNAYKVIKAMQARGWTVTPQTVRSVMKQKGLKD